MKQKVQQKVRTGGQGRGLADPLIGKYFRTKVRDSEEDQEYGECIHPPGSVFQVARRIEESEIDSSTPSYAVAWQGTSIQEDTRNEVPSLGMWTIWTRKEILELAEPCRKPGGTDGAGVEEGARRGGKEGGEDGERAYQKFLELRRKCSIPDHTDRLDRLDHLDNFTKLLESITPMELVRVIDWQRSKLDEANKCLEDTLKELREIERVLDEVFRG